MVYVPPNCGEVNFTLRTYTAPLCHTVNFDLTEGGTTSIEILTGDSFLGVFNTEIYFIDARIIQTDNGYLRITSTEMQFEQLIEILADNSTIHLYSDTALLQILPDIITHDSAIKMTSDLMNIGGGQEYDLPNKINGGISVNYKNAEIMDKLYSINWKDGLNINKTIIEKTNKMGELDNKVIVDWRVLNYYDKQTDLLSKNFDIIIDNGIGVNWKSLYVLDNSHITSYGFFERYDISINNPYKEPGPKDVFINVKTDSATIQNGIDKTFKVVWKSPGSVDVHKEVPWGPIDLFSFCSLKYYPPEAGPIKFQLLPINKNLVDTCYEVTFDVKGVNTDPRCPYKHSQSGKRDPYIWGIPIDISYFPSKKDTYYAMNTILVKRLPDNIPIEVTSVNIKYDKQSWLWSFSLTIGKDHNDYLDLIKPTTDNLNTYVDIEININGWIWICRVESYSETRSFPVDVWTVRGRSPSMEIGSPQNQRTSHVYDPEGIDATSGGQIIDEVLAGTILGIDNTGWTMDWSYYTNHVFTGFDPYSGDSWGIPPNTFSWDNLTQIEVIKQLTDSIGTFLMTDLANKKIIAKPIINIPPWHWNEEGPYKPDVDHSINSTYMTEVARSYESFPVYNCVFVMGQNSASPQKTNVVSGIPVVNVHRSGIDTGSGIYADDYTNPWIFTWQAATEKGRVILSETGTWLKHSLKLFSIANHADENPIINKLILPGDFVQVNERNAVWNGSVVGTEINASIVNRCAFTVYQKVEIDQYLGE